MKLLMLTALLLTAHGALAAEASSVGPDLSELVGQVRAADYRGAREDLRRLAGVLDASKDRLAAYRHYWRGFAFWRRALNGFNETPTPGDIEADLKAGLAAFRAALSERPDWIEPRIGMIGCWVSLFFFAGNDAAQTQAILNELAPVAREVREKAADNPRALWLRGGSHLFAPPPQGGDPVKAVATYRHGLESALQEARTRPGDEPAWIPRWGGAEILMSLAYLYSHSSLENRELAQAYAEGSLVAVPEWHYVRDILRPQIQALPDKKAPPVVAP